MIDVIVLIIVIFFIIIWIYTLKEPFRTLSILADPSTFNGTQFFQDIDTVNYTLPPFTAYNSYNVPDTTVTSETTKINDAVDEYIMTLLYKVINSDMVIENVNIKGEFTSNSEFVPIISEDPKILQESVKALKDNEIYFIKLLINFMNTDPNNTQNYLFSSTNFGQSTIKGTSITIPFFIYLSHLNYTKGITVTFNVNKGKVTISDISIPSFNDTSNTTQAISPVKNNILDSNGYFQIQNKYGLEYPYPTSESVMDISQESYLLQKQVIDKKYGKISYKNQSSYVL
jgi:hypothetical protein